MAKPSRWTAEKRYQIVKEALSQKEPLGQLARRHQVSERLIYRWRDKFLRMRRASGDAQASFADAVNVAAFFLTKSCRLSGPCAVSVRTSSDIRS